VSSINSTLYSFANYLQKILYKSFSLYNSHVKNSFELYNILQEKKIPENHVLISLDIISLFINIPLELIIEGINSRWHYTRRDKNFKNSIYNCCSIRTNFYLVHL